MRLNYLALSLLAASSLVLSACGDDAKAENSGNTSASASATTTNDTNSAKSEATNENSVKESTQEEAKDDALASEDKVSYAVGASVGAYIATMQREQGEFIGNLNSEQIIKGFTDAINDKPNLNEKEIADILLALDTKVREGIEAKHVAEAQKNLEAGKQYLAENAKKEGVKTTESGLQYKIITEGTGKTPTVADEVKVKYRGTTIDGEVFDEQSDPIAFPLTNIIPGWTEGLQLIKEGGKIELAIPSDLAYGEMGAGDIIKPNSVLLFEIELVEVIDQKASTPEAKE